MPPPLCVREGDWKLFVDHHGNSAQLFNISKDPGEHHDVALRNPDIVKALSDRALAWVKTLPPSPARDKVISGTSVSAKNAPEADTQKKAKLDRPKIFEAWDRDKDGLLSKEEFVPHISDQADAPARFIRFDKDGDGRLTKEEFVRAGN
jgi:hypothetical protein